MIEGRYIVVFGEGVQNVKQAIDRREQRLGIRSRHRYRHALPGFSARLTPGQLRRLREDPRVDSVGPVHRVRATAEVPLLPGETVPTGIRRIGAATATTAREASGIAVAVIDTGIQLEHPDLEAVPGTNCVSGGPPVDANGHGTHVAGTIGALNDGAGVVGVAPGTELYAVKVLPDSGPGSSDDVICGINWVTANHEALGIGVANMSLGGVSPVALGPCGSTSDPEHTAICNSTAAGVNYVVAAGNEGWDFDFQLSPSVPAAYPEVLTVTAIHDSDGQPGGLGPKCGSSPWDDLGDDSAAVGIPTPDGIQEGNGSNFAATAGGRAHTIAAPGVCINSTVPTSSYAGSTGTSMASPHAAGVVALCINEAGIDGPCAGRTPSQVIDFIRADAATFNNANPGYGFLRDPNRDPIPNTFYGFLVRALPAQTGVAPPPPPPPPPPTIVVPPSNEFQFARVRRIRRDGSAVLLIRVPGPGRVVLARARTTRRAGRSAAGAGIVRLPVRPRGAAQRRLSDRRCALTGARVLRVDVVARVAYRPTGGTRRAKRRRVMLVRAC